MYDLKPDQMYREAKRNLWSTSGAVKEKQHFNVIWRN